MENNTEIKTSEPIPWDIQAPVMEHEPPIDQRALIKVKPLQDDVIKAQVENAQKALDYAKNRVIRSAEDVKMATDDLAMISKLKKVAKEKLDEYIKPIKSHLDSVKDDFNSIMKPLEEADSVTRDKILSFNRVQTELRRKQEEAERAARAAAEAEMKANGELSKEILTIENKAEPVVEAHANVGDMNTAKVWKFEVEDFAALPDDYKIADMVKIRKVVIAGVKIPGVKAWQEDTLRITPR
jgi:chromosome segregation ATPase